VPLPRRVPSGGEGPHAPHTHSVDGHRADARAAPRPRDVGRPAAQSGQQLRVDTGATHLAADHDAAPRQGEQLQRGDLFIKVNNS
jgi:hypothetical protein